MAYYYGLNKGDGEFAASVSGSTTGKEIEIVVNQTAVTDKQALKTALENLINVVLKTNYPPV